MHVVKMLTDSFGTPNPCIYCPGCKREHCFAPKNSPDVSGWSWNGSMEKPTFAPSMLVTCGPFPEHSSRPGHTDICHSFVREGHIEFLGDCTHELKGQTVELGRAPYWKPE